MITLKKITSGLVTYIILTLLLSIYDFKNNTFTINYIIFAIGMAVATFISYKSYKKNNKLKKYYKILTFSIFSYFLGSLADIFNVNYFASSISRSFYLTCSIGLTFAICHLIAHIYTKWDLSYILLNLFVFSIFIVYIAWDIFLRKFAVEINNSKIETYFSMIFLFSTFLMALGILILFQLCKFTPHIKFLALGFNIYTITEFIHYYLIFNHNIVDKAYLFFLVTNLGRTLGLILLSCSSLYITDDLLPDYESSSTDTFTNHNNNRIRMSILTLFLISIIVSDHILITFLFVTLIIFRRICLKYIDTYLTNKQLNKDYILINEALSKTLEEIKAKNNELYFLANIDPLTSLPNRRNFVEHLDNLILKSNSTNKFALLFLGLDRFKSINDWHGHDVGDKLLMATCQRLKDNLSPNDFIARQGGDEFIIILNNLNDEYEALEKSRHLVRIFRQPFIIDGITINSTISIGISVYPINGNNRSDLMKFSDIALYSSKNSGKNTSCLYNFAMKKEENRKLELENRLYDAIAKEELSIYFQPQISIQTEELIGVEALIRWNNSQLGFIPPFEFISIAEENGFIINIGEWILDNACAKIKYLNDRYNRDIKVGINVSPKQFASSNMISSISNCISKYNMKPHWIDVEITEGCAIEDEKGALQKLLSLKELGVQISIDDFGTGYSSLAYLNKYPINTLKIALELVTDINTNQDNYNIVKAIISMCHDLNLNVIAEGVETKEQLDILKSLGCHEVQGYYFGKPMSFWELEDKFFKNI